MEKGVYWIIVKAFYLASTITLGIEGDSFSFGNHQYDSTKIIIKCNVDRSKGSALPISQCHWLCVYVCIVDFNVDHNIEGERWQRLCFTVHVYTTHVDARSVNMIEQPAIRMVDMYARDNILLMYSNVMLVAFLKCVAPLACWEMLEERVYTIASL